MSKSNGGPKSRPGTGAEMNVLYGRKAGAHADRRTKRNRTRSAQKAAALRDYR